MMVVSSFLTTGSIVMVVNPPGEVVTISDVGQEFPSRYICEIMKFILFVKTIACLKVCV